MAKNKKEVKKEVKKENAEPLKENEINAGKLRRGMGIVGDGCLVK